MSIRLWDDVGFPVSVLLNFLGGLHLRFSCSGLKPPFLDPRVVEMVAIPVRIFSGAGCPGRWFLMGWSPF